MKEKIEQAAKEYAKNLSDIQSFGQVNKMRCFTFAYVAFKEGADFVLNSDIHSNGASQGTMPNEPNPGNQKCEPICDFCSYIMKAEFKARDERDSEKNRVSELSSLLKEKKDEYENLRLSRNEYMKGFENQLEEIQQLKSSLDKASEEIKRLKNINDENFKITQEQNKIIQRSNAKS